MEIKHGDEIGSKNSDGNDSDVNSNSNTPQNISSTPSSLPSSSLHSSQEFDLDINVLNEKLNNSFQESEVDISAEKPPQPSSSNAKLPKGYDPQRIPLSIFTPKTTSNVDWSIASNESLFSIQVGNGSFSREQFHMMYKSGELPKLDEVSKKPKEPAMMGIAEQPIDNEQLSNQVEAENMDVERNEENVEIDQISETKMASSDDGVRVSNHSSTTEECIRVSNHSEESTYSGKSFTFQSLDTNGAKDSPRIDHSMQKPPATDVDEAASGTQTQQASETPSKIAKNSCLSWFYCFPRCR